MIAIVVVSRPGREEGVRRDLLDLLFPYDNKVDVIRTKYAGILVVFTNIRTDDIIVLLKKFPIKNLIKIRMYKKWKYINNYNLLEIKNLILDVIKEKKCHIKRIYCWERGKIFSCNEIKNIIYSYLNIVKKDNFSQGQCNINVDIIDNFVAINGIKF